MKIKLFNNLSLLTIFLFSFNLIKPAGLLEILQTCKDEDEMVSTVIFLKNHETRSHPYDFNQKGDYTSSLFYKAGYIKISGGTALHVATILKFKQLASLLICLGADINLQDSLLNTPFHYACYFEASLDFLNIFIYEPKFNKDLRNDNGVSCYDLYIKSIAR